MTQTVGEQRQVDHQGRVGEDQFAEVDEHVVLGAQRADEGSASQALGGAIFVARADQRRRGVRELDDARKLYKPAAVSNQTSRAGERTSVNSKE